MLDNFSTGRPENLQHIRHNVDICDCDLALQGSWSKHFEATDRVFHLAALANIVPSIQHPEAYFQANVTATLNVLQASVAAGVKRFVYAASSSCYGIPDMYPTPETAAMRPQYPYALTKRLGEELVLHWHQVYQLPAVSLRFFNVYGPRSRTSGTYGAVMGVFLAQKLKQQPFTVVGDGTQTRDFTYVTDIADACLAAANSPHAGHIYNIGSGTTVPINRLVELLEGETVYIPKRPGEPDCTFADTRKARQELQWSPRISIEEGVADVLRHIDYWRDAPLWTPESIAQATRDWFRYLTPAESTAR